MDGPPCRYFKPKRIAAAKAGVLPKRRMAKNVMTRSAARMSEVEDANAKTVEAAEEAKDGIGDETAWHLKIKEVAIWDKTFGAHEEGFVKKRRFVVCDGPLS